MALVEARKTILIKHDLNVTKEWSEFLHVGFVPDEMIVRCALYRNGGAENPLLYVTSSLLPSDDALCILTDGTTYNNPQSTFKMGNLIQGKVYFRALQLNGTLSTGVGDLMIMLEFIKLKR